MLPDCDYTVLEVDEECLLACDALILKAPKHAARFVRISDTRSYICGDHAILLLAIFVVWGLACALLGFSVGAS